ncbi:MAG TPA: xanthine dehydrogenase small subunit, partial [Burkholderiales bacterium]|nr:xanthine dehydrogenase small subunit [Burkholderiales bacterium]
VNSCIRFLPTLDGKEVVSVESLKGADNSLHPVQQAMVDNHASQCGFCTPGFVMSLFALYLNQSEASREDVVNALSGNLCRCTGYRPIIEAGCRMNAYAEPDVWSRNAARSPERMALLKSLQRGPDASLRIDEGYHAPLHIDELARLYEAQPQSLLLAGGTDIGLWVTKQKRNLPPLIYIGEVAELKEIRQVGSNLEIGAAVRLSDAYEAIVAHYPMLRELADRFASLPIRNSGTLCGNIANGSPIGDSMPILIALGASIELRCGAKTRSIPLDEFYLGYQKKALTAGEFVAAVRIPLAGVKPLVATYKISKRIDQDISAVCGAYVVELNDGKITSARIAYGGMAAIPKRATHMEEMLIGKSWSSESIELAISKIAEDFQPLSDMRASSDYRLHTAKNLMRRFYLEHSGMQAPIRVTTVSATQSGT